jgi:hypothetical protein
LPLFTGRVVTERLSKWRWGVPSAEQPKLQPLLDALKRLRDGGLAIKRKHGETLCTREALEKRRRQQERDGLPWEESPSEPDSDDGDFEIFFG